MQEQKYSIKQWAKDDRPREKLLLNGVHTLSDSELLAILILNGSKEKTAVDLAKDILKLSKDNLSELGRLSVKDLMKVKGIGQAKAVTISAALELGRRRQASSSLQKKIISSSNDIADYFMAKLKDYRHEVFAGSFFKQGQ
jgi:DNA repair protein RadC